MRGQGSRPRRATAWDVAGSGACGLGRRGEERLRLGGARGLPGDDEPSDQEQRADEEERRERAGAAGVRRGDVDGKFNAGGLRDGVARRGG